VRFDVEGGVVQAYIEVRGFGPSELFPLESKRLTIGRDECNDIALSRDKMVSHTHAAVEPYGASYALRDLGSSNGTYVNGQRLFGDRILRPGDEIQLGQSQLLFRSAGGQKLESTDTSRQPPELTRREREVLVALCRPLLDAAPFAHPASIPALADQLCVGEAAVKFHLSNLYEKFEIQATGQSRRLTLANEAIRRRAVTLSDLRG
jgi:predicted component of type VI protein secretion system